MDLILSERRLEDAAQGQNMKSESYRFLNQNQAGAQSQSTLKMGQNARQMSQSALTMGRNAGQTSRKSSKHDANCASKPQLSLKQQDKALILGPTKSREKQVDLTHKRSPLKPIAVVHPGQKQPGDFVIHHAVHPPKQRNDHDESDEAESELDFMDDVSVSESSSSESGEESVEGTVSAIFKTQGKIGLPDLNGISILSFTPAFSFSLFTLPPQYQKHKEELARDADAIANTPQSQLRKKRRFPKKKQLVKQKQKQKQTNIGKLGEKIQRSLLAKSQNIKAFMKKLDPLPSKPKRKVIISPVNEGQTGNVKTSSKVQVDQSDERVEGQEADAEEPTVYSLTDVDMVDTDVSDSYDNLDPTEAILHS